MLKVRGKKQVSNYTTFNYVSDIIQGCLLFIFATIFEHKSVAFRWFAPQREVFPKDFFSKCE